jgi:hypothetical protein
MLVNINIEGTTWSGNADSFMPSLASLRDSTLNTQVSPRRLALFATDPPCRHQRQVNCTTV